MVWDAPCLCAGIIMRLMREWNFGFGVFPGGRFGSGFSVGLLVVSKITDDFCSVAS